MWWVKCPYLISPKGKLCPILLPLLSCRLLSSHSPASQAKKYSISTTRTMKCFLLLLLTWSCCFGRQKREHIRYYYTLNSSFMLSIFWVETILLSLPKCSFTLFCNCCGCSAIINCTTIQETSYCTLAVVKLLDFVILVLNISKILTIFFLKW